MSSGHNVRTTSWITVLTIVAAVIVLGFALPLHSMILAIVGGALLLVGLVLGGLTRIMDDAY